ncbi:MAG: ribonuclease III [Clostridiales bacterium]|nr:ribonuclease III [Clostridiales bacterium]
MEGWGIPDEPISARDAELKNPLALAFIGDTVWDLLVRRRLLATSARVNALHRQAVGLVNAGAQAKALCRLEPLLTGTESDIVRRGVNAHSRHVTPRNQDPVDYRRATGLEAMLGWLYLSGQWARVSQLFDAAYPPGTDIDPPARRTD